MTAALSCWFRDERPGPATHALVIGISTYPHRPLGLADLPGAATSADMFAHWLRNPPPTSRIDDGGEPASTQRLALDEEAREIQGKLRRARERDPFELAVRWAERPQDLGRFLNEINPHIVHFSGHGSPAEQIVLSTSDRPARPADPAALAETFRVMRNNVVS